MSFKRFDEQARLTIVLAQDECRLLRHGDIGADHLLVAIARVDETILGLAPERLRDVLVRLRGARERRESPDALPFSAEAMAAVESADDQATSRPHACPTRSRPARPARRRRHGLADPQRRWPVGARRSHCGRARRRPSGIPRRAAASCAACVGRMSALDEGRLEDAVRDGHPVMARRHNAPPVGDIGNALVDARLLKLMLAADGRLAQMLRAHGVDEAAVDAVLEPPA